MRKETREKLNSLKLTDVYSLILFAIYKMRDVPEYSTLSELVYLVDQKSLFNLLEYFGGMTITIPTAKDFKLVINALLLYQYVNLEGIEFNQALQLLEQDCSAKEVKECYVKVSNILTNYDFKRN